jgi:hypothetical protein
METRLDIITRTITAFQSFAELCNDSAKTGYVPTIRGWDPETMKLADILAVAFDVEMSRRGRATRAWPRRTGVGCLRPDPAPKAPAHLEEGPTPQRSAK